jgi:hypothetical protein
MTVEERGADLPVKISSIVIEPEILLVFNVPESLATFKEGRGTVLTDKDTCLALNDTLHNVLNMMSLGGTLGFSLSICKKHCILHECISPILMMVFSASRITCSLASDSSTLIDVWLNPRISD